MVLIKGYADDPIDVIEVDIDPPHALTGEQRLWIDVLFSAIREAFSRDLSQRSQAREWLFSNDDSIGSAVWACDVTGIEGLDRVRRWVLSTRVLHGRASARGICKGRP